MDYTDDACADNFTPEQINRIDPVQVSSLFYESPISYSIKPSDFMFILNGVLGWGSGET